MTDYIDGPRLVAWLEERRNLMANPAISPSVARRIYHWRHGGAAWVYGSLDRLLIALDIALAEVPEEFYVPCPHGGKR